MFRHPQFVPSIIAKESTQQDKHEEKGELSYDLLREKIFRVLKRSDSENSEDEAKAERPHLPEPPVFSNPDSSETPLPQPEQNEKQEESEEKTAKKSSKKIRNRHERKTKTREKKLPETPKKKHKRERSERSSASSGEKARTSSLSKQPVIHLEPPSPPEVITMVSQVTASDSEVEGPNHYLRVPNVRHQPATKKKSVSRRSAKKSTPEHKVPKEKQETHKVVEVEKKGKTKMKNNVEIQKKEIMVFRDSLMESDHEQKTQRPEDHESRVSTAVKKRNVPKDQQKRRKSVIVPKVKMTANSEQKPDESGIESHCSAGTEEITPLGTDVNSECRVAPEDKQHDSSGDKLIERATAEKMLRKEKVERESKKTVAKEKLLANVKEKKEMEAEKIMSLSNEQLSLAAQECWTIHQRLLQEGLRIPLTTLQRGLLTPTEMRLMMNTKLEKT